MKPIWEQHRIHGKKFSRIHPAVVDVLPPSLPVPRKFAAELRRRLKMLQDESDQYKSECGNDIPF